MRRKLWLQFHLWTIALVGVITVANVVSFLRPFAHAGNAAVNSGLILSSGTAGALLNLGQRSPASSDGTAKDSHTDARFALKTARIGCEAVMRLSVVSAVRQVRLQFASCDENDSIVGIKNKTNEFEATIFSSAKNTPAAEMFAGTFTTPEDAKAAAKIAAKVATKPGKSAKKDRKIATDSASSGATSMDEISTDYISLSPGENEIQIHRTGREQILKIERK